jgi:D-threo-aldose 1-dehydrogenase
VRHFDTAPHYGAGLSEHRIGAVLRLHSPRRLYAFNQGWSRIGAGAGPAGTGRGICRWPTLPSPL